MIIKQKFTEPEIEVKWYCDSIEEIVIVNRICQNLETGLEALLPAPATLYVYVLISSAPVRPLCLLSTCNVKIPVYAGNKNALYKFDE